MRAAEPLVQTGLLGEAIMAGLTYYVSVGFPDDPED
jgi:hypothetical protein